MRALLLAQMLGIALAFRSPLRAPRSAPSKLTAPPGRTGTVAQEMVFDFFKKKAEEGIADLKKFTDGLAKSRDRLLGELESIFGGDKTLDATIERLEEVLMMADIGTATTLQILDDVRDLARQQDEKLSADDIRALLRANLVEVLENTETRALNFASEGPTVLFVIGSNGMGKTTTIGKIANRLRSEGGQKVLLCAADTFRAAAVEQLEQWAVRADVDIVTPLPDTKGPGPVVSAAVEKCLSEGYDTLIVDTSGRLANNYQLNEELKRLQRIIQKRIDGAPHDTLLVVDASLGRNAVDQASTWKKEVGVTGMIVTKLDGTARGGFVVSTVQELDIPIKLVGVGEKLDDLRDFEPESFVDALLGYEDGEGAELQARLQATRQAVAKEEAAKKEAAEKQMMEAMAQQAAAAEEVEETATAPAGKRSAAKSKDKKRKRKKKKQR